MKNSPPQLTNRTSYRVIYGDTDQMGVVYYANYLRWFERGRSEFLRQLGLPYATVERQGVHFPVLEVICSYKVSARYDDVIDIVTELAELGRASMTFRYRILRAADRLILAHGTTKHASIDGSGRIVRIPQNIFDAVRSAGG